MPFRRNPKLLEQLNKKLADNTSVSSSVKILGMLELLVERIYAIAKILLWAAVIQVVVVISLTVMVQRRNSSIDNIKHASEETKTAAKDAKVAANAAKIALDAATSPAATKSAQEAIEAIRRIEQSVCGGPCPAASTTPGGDQ